MSPIHQLHALTRLYDDTRKGVALLSAALAQYC